MAHVFDYPLEVLLDPELAHSEKLMPVGSEDWPYEAELYVSPRHFCAHMCRQLTVAVSFAVSFVGQNFKDNDWIGTTYHLHRFRSTASPIKRLTADILVRHTPFLSLCGLLIVIFKQVTTTRIAYAREPVFQQWGPGQLKTFEEIQLAVEAAAIAAAASHSYPTLSHGHVAPTTIIRA